jgi:hypothetical protein
MEDFVGFTSFAASRSKSSPSGSYQNQVPRFNTQNQLASPPSTTCWIIFHDNPSLSKRAVDIISSHFSRLSLHFPRSRRPFPSLQPLPHLLCLNIPSQPQPPRQSRHLNTHPACSPRSIDVTSTNCSNPAPGPLSAGATTAEIPTWEMYTTRTTGSASSAARRQY